ncbi:hypothetical protein GGI12_002052 [Dipsacomyces acuminosporus]|nr:hypothetical protein GGI12_002052 [Dipsacomyces acuminosporus]
MAGKVVVITGGNSGVGFALAERLLSSKSSSLHPITVVLACRNVNKAEKAKSELLELHPNSAVELVQLDTASLSSVNNAAKEIMQKHKRLDILYCNAGAMAIDSMDIWGSITGLLTHPIEFFESSEALRQKAGLVTKDGLGETFQANVFGHYFLIHKLVPLLQSTGNARVVWTGSSASRLQFSLEDYQHVKGEKAYESSKYIVDQIAIPLDEKLHQKGIRCFVAEPGNVCTNFLSGLNIPFMPFLVLLTFYFIRVVVGLARFTITAENSCFANWYLGTADGKALDARLKYHSEVSRLGEPYVKEYPITYHKDTGSFLVNKLDELVARFDSEFD